MPVALLGNFGIIRDVIWETQMISISSFKISSLINNKLAEIDYFKGLWKGKSGILGQQNLRNLKRISTIESIGSSNRIEGNQLSDTNVASVLSNLKKQSFRSRDEEEVAGYAKLLNTIYDHSSEISITENYIKQMHQIMLGRVSKDIHHCGEYKKISNAIAAFDADGHEIGIVFQTATPFDTPFMMRELVNWVNEALEERFWHPLIVIGVFIVHFLAIHPFQDGNGRLSRALTTLLLLKTGYDYVPYSSIESIIETNKSSYYSALRNTQKSIWTDDVDYDPWLDFFLSTLHKQANILIEKIELLRTKSALSKNAQAVLSLFDQSPQWTMQEMLEKVSMNPETVRKIVRNLCKQKYIVKFGTTKSVFYRKMD